MRIWELFGEWGCWIGRVPTEPYQPLDVVVVSIRLEQI